jgi:hypothetical protein
LPPPIRLGCGVQRIAKDVQPPSLLKQLLERRAAIGSLEAKEAGGEVTGPSQVFCIAHQSVGQRACLHPWAAHVPARMLHINTLAEGGSSACAHVPRGTGHVLQHAAPWQLFCWMWFCIECQCCCSMPAQQVPNSMQQWASKAAPNTVQQRPVQWNWLCCAALVVSCAGPPTKSSGSNRTTDHNQIVCS